VPDVSANPKHAITLALSVSGLILAAWFFGGRHSEEPKGFGGALAVFVANRRPPQGHPKCPTPPTGLDKLGGKELK